MLIRNGYKHWEKLKTLVPREAGKLCGFPHLWGTFEYITVPTPERQNHTPPGRVTPRQAETPQKHGDPSCPLDRLGPGSHPFADDEFLGR